ncbi:MAG: glutamine-hydrolyzing GMP synthase, partial [Clostridia bacterium]|nr:glutamine-hydrolyzing GMP synthase [Clostridia bacterium]
MEKILVLDFGGQYNQLIARRVRDQHVFAEIVPYNRITPEKILSGGYRGIIFTGGPNSVYDPASPHYPREVLELGIPVLGICYGCQLIAYIDGGTIESAGETSEYGMVEHRVTDRDCPLFKGVPEKDVCWMSHTDYVSRVPKGYSVCGVTDNCPCAAMYNAAKRVYGVQFHPEVTHTRFGQRFLRNFLYDICGLSGDWTAGNFAESAVSHFRESLAGKKVLMALSGGVDSSVAAVLLHKAVGDDLTCVFVDHGLLRKDEGDIVEKTFKGRFGLNLIRVNAADRFLARLKGVTEPERKRKIIG